MHTSHPPSLSLSLCLSLCLSLSLSFHPLHELQQLISFSLGLDERGKGHKEEEEEEEEEEGGRFGASEV